MTTEVGKASATGVRRRSKLEMNFMMATTKATERKTMQLATRELSRLFDLKIQTKRTKQRSLYMTTVSTTNTVSRPSPNHLPPSQSIIHQID